MGLRSPIEVGSLSLSTDLQRCLAWSSALASPRPPTTITVVLTILETSEAPATATALANARIHRRDLEPLELAARPPPERPKGIKRLARFLSGASYSRDLDDALKRAAQRALLNERRSITTDDLFVSLLLDDTLARRALLELGADLGALRTELTHQQRPSPD